MRQQLLAVSAVLLAVTASGCSSGAPNPDTGTAASTITDPLPDDGGDAQDSGAHDTPAESENGADTPARSEDGGNTSAQSEGGGGTPARSEHGGDTSAQSEGGGDTSAQSEDGGDTSAQSEDEGDPVQEMSKVLVDAIDRADSDSDVPASAFNADSPQITVTDYLNSVVQHVDRFWTNYFVNQAGLQEPYTGYVIVQDGQQYQSACRDSSGIPLILHADTPNAYYCGADAVSTGYPGTIWLPVFTFQKMWTGNIFERQSRATGDFGAAVVAAHEFGHSVVDELAEQIGARNGTTVNEPQGTNGELIADCFAGNWMASVYYEGVLTGSDFTEATSAIEAIGDFDVTSPGHHGTPEERTQALQAGYNGTPVTCVQQYWR